jgi:hypothetical protein
MSSQVISTKTLSQHTGIPASDIDALLALPAEDIFSHEVYMGLLQSLDSQLLEETLPNARAVYEEHLPTFKETLANHHHINTEPMSPYTLGNWLVGVARYPETASGILKMHENVPGNIVAANLASLIDMLDDMPDDAVAAWKQAICVLSIPLMRM